MISTAAAHQRKLDTARAHTGRTSPPRGVRGRRRRDAETPTGEAAGGPVPVVAGRDAIAGSAGGLRVSRHRATTAHLAAVHPFHGGHLLSDLQAPYVGVNATDGGSAWSYDPFELYGRDLGGTSLTNSNMLVLGEPGNGKSTAVKTLLWRQAGFYANRRFIAISDPKGEYGPLAAALGMPTVKLSPGGRDRLNPLDAGPGDPGESVLARQQLLIGMIGVALNRDLNVIEETILGLTITKLDAAHHTGRPATLGDLAGLLAAMPAELRQHPHMALVAEQDLNAALTALGLGLVKLLEQTLRGMFDGPSTVPADWMHGRGIVIDLSSVFAQTQALQLVQMTANSWLTAQLADLQTQGRRGILVEDEVWATTASERAAKTLQARLKLCRLYGVWNILVTHRLSDLRAQADDGSSASKVAEGLIADIQTRVVFRQSSSQIEETGRLLQLNTKTTRLLTDLPKGWALWLVAGRHAVVHHVVGYHELELTDTDAAMTAT